MTENRLFIIVTILLPAFCTATGYSVQNPSVNNPAGTTTRPQSYYTGSSLVNTSNSINTNGNEIVTGNVRRGMAFQGDVPYSSTSSFNATLGSSTLSSFMRDTAGSEDISGSRSKYTVGSAGANYQSYYLPSSTVTTMSQNTSGIASTGNTTINNGSQYLSGSQVPQNQPVISSQNTQAQSTTLWHLYNPGLAGTQSRNNTLSQMRSESSSSRPNEQQTRQENGKYRQDETAAYQQYMQQTLRSGTPDGQTNPNTIQNTRNNQQYVENRTTATQPLAELPLYSSQQTTEQNNQWQQSLSPSRYDIQETASSTTTSQPASANMQQFVPPQRGYQTLATGEFDTAGEQVPLTSGLPGTLNRYGPTTENTSYQPNTGSARMSAPQYQRQINKYPSTQDNETTETLSQIQRQLDDLIRSIDSRYQTSTYEATQSGTVEQEMPDLLRTGTSYRTGQTNQGPSGQNENRRNQTLTGLSETSQSQGSQYGTSRLTELKEMSQSEISARAQRIMGQYEDYESFSQAKYIQLYRAAEGHLNIGRFNQAADTFALASIYKPEDPLCYAGRGHALFAAGEYVSSALHLIRAIELDPEYTQTQIDLAELVGGRDKLDSNINDLNKWLQKSHAPGLGFLLGYVNYQTGRFNEAKQVMDVVMQEMPQSKAATALKMTIESKLTTQKQSQQKSLLP